MKAFCAHLLVARDTWRIKEVCFCGGVLPISLVVRRVFRSLGRSRVPLWGNQQISKGFYFFTIYFSRFSSSSIGESATII